MFHSVSYGFDHGFIGQNENVSGRKNTNTSILTDEIVLVYLPIHWNWSHSGST